MLGNDGDSDQSMTVESSFPICLAVEEHREHREEDNGTMRDGLRPPQLNDWTRVTGNQEEAPNGE